MKKILGLSAIVFAAPLMAFAQWTDLDTAFGNILKVLDALIPIIIAIAVIAVLWGIAKFVFNAGDPEERKKGRDIIIWGVVGIFVMISIWGLVNFLDSTFDLDNAAPVDGDLPTVPDSRPI